MPLRPFRCTDYIFAYMLVRQYKNISRGRNLKTMWSDLSSEKRIITDGENDIGVITERNHEISILIMPNFINKGYGTKALKQFLHLLKKDFYFVKILSSNTKSLNFFKKSGFTKRLFSNKYVYLFKNAP